MNKMHVLESWTSCPVSPANSMTARMLRMGFFTAVWEFLHCFKKENRHFPKEWFKFAFVFFVYAVNIYTLLLALACIAQLILYTLFQ